MKKRLNASETFGAYIRSLRIKNNIGQRELAKKIRVAPSYLNDMEKNKRSAPSIDLIKKFKKIVQIPFAIDESIIDGSYKQIVNEKLVDFAILKPSLYGSIKKFLKLKKFLELKKIRLVLSSSLETEIGNMASIHISSILGSDLNHGLNNYYFYDYEKFVVYNKKDTKVNLNRIIGLGVCCD